MRIVHSGSLCHRLLGLVLAFFLGALSLPAEPAMPVAPASFLARDSRVILQAEIVFPEAALKAEEREKLSAELQTALATAVKEAGLTVVDHKANEAARKAAEQRAVMQDAAPEKVAEALRPFAVDAVLRVNVAVSPPVLVTSANVWITKWQMTVDRIDGRNKTKAKESWRLPADPADARASTGKGETAEKACHAVIKQITSRFSRSLREKILGSTGAAADKKAN